MKAYKLVRKMKDGSLSPLFINQKSRLPIGEWMQAELHPRKGFAVRQGWHCTLEPKAPHLSEKGRVWVEVEIEDYEYYNRPESQGGTWVLAQRMRVLRELPFMLEFTGMFRELKPRGYTFQRLFGMNYIHYFKDMDRMTIWVRKGGRLVWVKDWYEHTSTILRFYEANKHKATEGPVSKQVYLTAMFNRDTGEIEIKDYAKEWKQVNGKWKPTFYYSDNGYEEIFLRPEAIDPILEELKAITNYDH